MKLILEHGHPRSFDSYVATYTAKVHDATDFQYQAFSSLDKHDIHVATIFEVAKRKHHHKICGAD